MRVVESVSGRGVLVSRDPATGEVVGEHPVLGPEEVRAVVARAREAAVWWEGLGFAGRKERLRAWKGELARGLEELAALIRHEMGKPLDDARLEIVAALGNIEWAASHAGRVLRPRRVRPPLAAIDQAAWVEYEPFGVVGVIGPWNFPVNTPIGLISAALAAGNAVVFKPSEVTPGVGVWLADAFARAVPEGSVLRVVSGNGETGEALCASGVDKIAFTGSSETGRKVMRACAETLTPMVLELGGKDAMIVAEDADVGAAAGAAVWGGFQNAGQGCISVERVFVVAALYDRFLERVAELASKVRAGPDADIGPIVLPRQLERIQHQVEDAIRRGARLVVGEPGSASGPYVAPVVIAAVSDDAIALREETFGPMLPVVRVRDAEEAVARANASKYALGASVFSRRRGEEIARRLKAGMVPVNGVITYSFVPGLPSGGSGESGFGRKHGEEGLKEFVRPRAIARQRSFALPVAMRSFDRPKGAVDRVVRLARLAHGYRPRSRATVQHAKGDTTMRRGMQEGATRGFERLARARAIMLTTYRRSGEGVGTTVWLAIRDGRILVTTTPTSGKVKRIRNDDRVTVAPCTQFGRVTGAAEVARARLMTPEETETALAAIRGRYGLLDRFFSLINRLQGETGEVGIEITPARDAPRDPRQDASPLRGSS